MIIYNYFRRKNLLLIQILILLISATRISQAEDKVAVKLGDGYGIFGGYDLNFHRVNFQKLPGIPTCCPRYESGEGSGLTLGLIYEIPFIEELGSQIRLRYSGLDGQMKSSETTFLAINDTTAVGEFSYVLDSKLSVLGVEPQLYYKLSDKFRINAGINLSMLINKTFYQKDEITRPSDRGTFLNQDGTDSRQRVRFERTGTIDQTNDLQLSVMGAVSYEMTLNRDRSLLLYPEISYNFSLLPIVKDYEWHTDFLKLGFSLLYSTTKYEKIQEENAPGNMDQEILARLNEIEVVGNTGSLVYGAVNPKDDEFITNNIELETPIKIKAVGINEGVEDDKAILTVEEFLSNQMKPLLPFVFFDKMSASIPVRYSKLTREQAESFEITRLNKDGTIQTYHNLLNIIAKRLRQYPDASITITGCNSDNEGEKGNKALSKQRAQAVTDYFRDVWGIEEARIKVQYRNLPDKFSNNKVNDGNQENRRVEISASRREILEPVITSDTLVKASPPVFRFYPKIDQDLKYSEWKITVSQNGNILKVLSGNDKIPDKIEWRIDKEKESIPRFDGDINYGIELKTESKWIGSRNEILPLEQVTIRKKRENRIGDKRIDKYSLILFDFNSSELSDDNSRICDFIKSNVETNSKVLITGYTDRMGDENKNMQLSEDRAKAVGKYMNNKNVYTRPMGATDLLYDNDLPEGRYYCRTVEVEVETPIKW